MIRLYIGWDAREALGAHCFIQSVLEKSSVPVSITPVSGRQRDASTAFGYSRFLVPYLSNFTGMSIFADGSDMLSLADLAELWELRDPWKALQIVKHEYTTKHPRKMVGTEMESENRDMPRKNWSSLMIFNNAHYANRLLTPAFVGDKSGDYLHRFAWLPDDRIGELPVEWNWLCDEFGANSAAKLLHWTCGQPGFLRYRDAPHADEWRAVANRAMRGLDYQLTEASER